MQKNITITTDASVCSHKKIGGWAVWISTYKGSFKFSGEFKDQILSPTDAEVKAATIGLHLFISRVHIKCETLIVNSDCKHVIITINKIAQQHSFDKVKSGEMLLEYVNRINEIGINVVSRHVKAHTKTDDARSFVNRWCDHNARKHMRNARRRRNECTSGKGAGNKRQPLHARRKSKTSDRHRG